MKSRQRFRSYLAWLLATVGVIVAACFAVNCLVDPLWYLRGNVLTGVNFAFNERLAAIIRACSQAPRSAADLLKTLFRFPLDRGVMALAFGEACAHVNRLLEDGRITARLEADGVERYAA